MRNFANKILFTNTIRYYSQYINKYFYEAKFDIYQIYVTISFRFLRINFKGGTSCHDLYRGIRVNVNRPRLIIELRTNRPIRSRSLGSKRSKVSGILHGSYGNYPDWSARFLYS